MFLGSISLSCLCSLIAHWPLQLYPIVFIYVSLWISRYFWNGLLCGSVIQNHLLWPREPWIFGKLGIFTSKLLAFYLFYTKEWLEFSCIREIPKMLIYSSWKGSFPCHCYLDTLSNANTNKNNGYREMLLEAGMNIFMLWCLSFVSCCDLETVGELDN